MRASTNNWALLRERLAASDIEGKEAMLGTIDERTGHAWPRTAITCPERRRVLTVEIEQRGIPRLLTALNPASDAGLTSSEANWRTIRAAVVASDMPDKDKVLEIIDSESDPAVRERKLRELNGGAASTGHLPNGHFRSFFRAAVSLRASSEPTGRCCVNKLPRQISQVNNKHCKFWTE